MKPNNNQAQRPEKNFRVGGVRAAVWAWSNTTKDGRTFTQPKVVLDRSYRDAQGEWKNTNSYAANDIPKAILALTKAYEYLHRNDSDNQNTPEMTEESVE